jgi:hypothetical protein
MAASAFTRYRSLRPYCRGRRELIPNTRKPDDCDDQQCAATPAHFDLRQTINFAVEPINNDDVDSERLRWRGAGTIAGTMPRSSMFSFLAAGGKAICA